MKVLFVGLGSIANKHISALNKIDEKIEIIALRRKDNYNVVLGVENIFDFSEIPSDLNFIVVSNPTSMHYSTVVNLIKLNKPFFIEKPSFSDLDQAIEISKLVRKHKIKTYTAFNLRFHPVIVWLKENIHTFQVYEVQAYCGSYLPYWRPCIDYRENYSAKKELGGGVHLDLIHELDYLIWIFGEPLKSNLFLKKLSDLEINSFDSASYFLEYETKIINIKLNYFRKDPKRTIEIVTSDSTLYIDILQNKIVDSNSTVLFDSKETVQETYYHQMNYFIDAIKNNKTPMNDVYESTRTLKYALQSK